MIYSQKNATFADKMLILLIFSILFVGSYARADIVWPTDSPLFAQGRPFSEFIQPTQSGIPSSGLWGDVRSSGYRFHEGIDIKAQRKDRRGEALDDVYAAMDGTVKFVNRYAGKSSYGRYVVIEHENLDVPVYTLYAHLASVENRIEKGAKVAAGTRLGTMGRSASTGIPKSRAHLHFEIGLRMADNFEPWYKSQKFGSPNYCGNFNGMNLFGFDPLEVFTKAKEGRLTTMKDHIQGLKTAYVIRVYTRSTPDFVRNYPALVENDGEKVGWDIYFTWFGMPQKFARIKDPRPGAREGEVEIILYDPAEINRKCRKFVVKDRKGNVVMTNDMKEHLKLIF